MHGGHRIQHQTHAETVTMNNFYEIMVVALVSSAISMALLMTWAKADDLLRDWKYRREAKAKKDAEQDARLANLER